MQAHFSHLPLPNSDYLTDTKSVLDQAIRVMQVRIFWFFIFLKHPINLIFN